PSFHSTSDCRGNAGICLQRWLFQRCLLLRRRLLLLLLALLHLLQFFQQLFWSLRAGRLLGRLRLRRLGIDLHLRVRLHDWGPRWGVLRGFSFGGSFVRVFLFIATGRALSRLRSSHARGRG